MELSTYQATDRRVYNGALCSGMLGERSHTIKLMEELHKLEPRAVSTYFPMEDKYLVSIRHQTDQKLWFEELSFEHNKQVAIIKAIGEVDG